MPANSRAFFKMNLFFVSLIFAGMGVLHIPPLPQFFLPRHPRNELRCQGPPSGWGGGGAKDRDQREVWRERDGERRHLGGREIGERWREPWCVPSPSPLCLIMSPLVLILASDTLHFIKGLTFVCNSPLDVVLTPSGWSYHHTKLETPVDLFWSGVE